MHDSHWFVDNVWTMFGQQISRREKCFRNYNNNNNNCIQLGKVSIETLKTNKYRNGRKPAFSRSLCAIELNWVSMRCAIEKAHNLCHLWATNIISIQPVRYIQWFVATVKREHTHTHNDLTISNAFHIWYFVRYSRNIERTTIKKKQKPRTLRRWWHICICNADHPVLMGACFANVPTKQQ